MPSEDSLPPASGIASQKRAREEVETPLSVRALQDTDTCMAFHVLSDSTSCCRAEDLLTLGPLGFHAAAAQDGHRAHITQLSWACAALGEAPRHTTERFVKVPGSIETGDELGDVLIQFADALLHASTPRTRTKEPPGRRQ